MTFGDDTETYGELKKILLERYDSAIKNGILNPRDLSKVWIIYQKDFSIQEN